MAQPQGRKTFLRDRELAAAIRGYYGARTGMLIAFWGILVGLVVALFLWRKAMLASAGHQAALIAAAGVCALVPFVVAVVLANRVVRRFSRGCIGRAPGPSDIRIARSDDPARTT